LHTLYTLTCSSSFCTVHLTVEIILIKITTYLLRGQKSLLNLSGTGVEWWVVISGMGI